MALIDRNREPTATELRVFGVLLAAFCGLVGGLIVYHTQAWTIAGIVWSLGALTAGIYYGVPSTGKSSFRRGWLQFFLSAGWFPTPCWDLFTMAF